MTINHSMRFTRHAWAMPHVPGLPIGVWTASSDDEGDASGGQITFQHIFRNTSNNLGDTNLYNIEHVMVAGQSASQDGCLMRINGMDPGTGQVSFPAPIDRIYTLPLIPSDASIGGFTEAAGSDLVNRPIWVGTYSGPDTDLGDVLFSLQNIDSTRVVIACYGYYWSPGAVNAAGGIRRPIDGIFGA